MWTTAKENCLYWKLTKYAQWEKSAPDTLNTKYLDFTENSKLLVGAIVELLNNSYDEWKSALTDAVTIADAACPLQEHGIPTL